jgi:hypothetical protein
MGKVVKAEYHAETQMLRLLEPLDGFQDHEQVTADVNKVAPERPWKSLRGILSKEAGDDLARAIDEMFPIEK